VAKTQEMVELIWERVDGKDALQAGAKVRGKTAHFGGSVIGRQMQQSETIWNQRSAWNSTEAGRLRDL